MPFEVSWYVEGRVSLGRDWGDHTLEEMQASNRISLEHIRTGTPPVHLMFDTLEVTSLPRSYLPMLREIEAFRHEPNMGWTVMITHSSVLHLFGVLSSNLIRQPFAAVTSYEEANAVLLRADPSLADLLPDAPKAAE